MTGHEPRSKVASIAIFLLPLLLVKGSALLLRDGAQQAQGASDGIPVVPPPAALPSAPAWTPVQQMAASHVAALRSMSFGSSPLYHPQSASAVDTTEVEQPDQRVLEPPPNVTVQIIMTTKGDGDVALIDRKRYRVGDSIGNGGWSVLRIDSHTRSVTLHHPPTDRTVTLLVPLPR